MKNQSKNISERRAWLPYFILAAGLGLTAAISYFLSQNVKMKSGEEFRAVAQQVENDIETRAEAYTALLRGGGGLFAVNNWVTQSEFEAYVRRLRIAEYYPGIQGIGVVMRMDQNSRTALLAKISKQGTNQFKIFPASTRGEIFPIVYLEPLSAKNKTRIGFDEENDPVRFAAIERARDIGLPAATGRLSQMDETNSAPSFDLFVPVYRSGGVPETLAERRETLEGFIFADFAVRDFLLDCVKYKPILDFQIYDGEAREENLIYKTESQKDSSVAKPAFEESASINIAGRIWQMSFQSRPQFERKNYFLQPLAPIVGVLISLLLFYLTHAEARARRRAEQVARELQKSQASLQQSEELQRTITETAADGIITMDAGSRILSANPAAERIFGYKAEELIGMNLSMLMPERFRAGHHAGIKRFLTSGEKRIPWGGIEFPGLHKNGQEIPLEISFGMFSLEEESVFTGIIRDVFLRKKAEESLRISENRFRLLFEQSPLAIQIFAPDGTSRGQNTAWEKLWGRPAEGAVDYNILKDENLKTKGVFSYIERGFHGETVSVPAVLYDPREAARAGRSRWVEAYVYPVKYNDKISEVVLLFHDVTDQKEAEQALQKSQQQLQLVTDSLPALIGYVDKDFRYRFTNLTYEKWFSLPRSQIQGSDMREVLGEAYTHLEPHAAKALRGVVAHFDGKIPFRGGARFVEGNYIPDFDLEKNVVGFFVLMSDVTQRRAAEEALRETEQHFRLIVERAQDYAIFTLDIEGKISTWNIGAERILGFEENEILGREIDIIFTPEDRAQGIPEQEKLTAQKTGQALDERWHLRKDGSRFWASGYMIALRSDDGTLRGFAKIMRDMTERKTAEQAIQKLNQELETRVQDRTAALRESYEQMETFTYTVAHDLRAPLRSMHGFADALWEEYGPHFDEAGKNYLRRIVASSLRMDALIQDLLSYSQLARSEMKFDPLPLQEIIEMAVALMSDEIAEKKAVISIEGKFPWVNAHKSTLQGVIANLIVNALKFQKPDAPARIRIWSEEKDRITRLWVEDNGIGIAREHQERIFKIFERLHAQGDFPGTGIGLALVRKGIERMGGRVGVESKVGEGSRFWLELPTVDEII